MVVNWRAWRPVASAARTFSILSSRKRASAGRTPSFVAGEGVDGGVGLGDAEFTGPGELVEVGEPGEFLAHGAENFGDHVGEDGGEDAGVLQGGGPGEHGLVEARST